MTHCQVGLQWSWRWLTSIDHSTLSLWLTIFVRIKLAQRDVNAELDTSRVYLRVRSGRVGSGWVTKLSVLGGSGPVSTKNLINYAIYTQETDYSSTIIPNDKKFFHHRVAPPFEFSNTKRDGNIPTGTHPPPLTGASNARGYEKITIFDQDLALSRKWCKIEP